MLSWIDGEVIFLTQLTFASPQVRLQICKMSFLDAFLRVILPAAAFYTAGKAYAGSTTRLLNNMQSSTAAGVLFAAGLAASASRCYLSCLLVCRHTRKTM